MSIKFLWLGRRRSEGVRNSVLVCLNDVLYADKSCWCILETRWRSY